MPMNSTGILRCILLDPMSQTSNPTADIPANVRQALTELAEFPLLAALYGRRSRRFPLGGEIPDGLLAYRSRHAALPLSELERATLMEVGNILASACLNALGNTLKMTLLPSVPTLMSGSGEALFERIQEQGREGESIVMIDTVFSISDAPCGGSIFLVPATSSVETMLAALEKQ